MDMSWTRPRPSVVRSTVGSWMTTTWPSLVSWTSNSTRSAPTSSAAAKAASVFSATWAESPRWAMMSGGIGGSGLPGQLGGRSRAGQGLLVDLGLHEDVEQLVVELARPRLVAEDVEGPL